VTASTAATTAGQVAEQPSATRPAVALEQVTKRYDGRDGVLALDGISLSVQPGEFLTLVGASGCGKSTLLNIVSGLDQPTSGSVQVDGLAAFMFQEHALFPWLSALTTLPRPCGWRESARRIATPRPATIFTLSTWLTSPTVVRTSCPEA